MNYWITTHWPPPEDERRFSKTGAWVRDNKREVLGEMRPGDLLFIYESKSGKTTIKKTAGENQKRVRRIGGREGVVALAEITGEALDLGREGYEFYSDGSEAWWRWKANGHVINSKGFIGRRSLAKILGYSERYNFHGFGDQKSGVMRLSLETFEAIRSAFLASEADIETVVKRKQSFARSYGGGGGEGPLHKSLKEYIAANPEKALGEEGLRKIAVEHPFPTGDRLDILLQDKNGCLVAVEVEVDCDEEEVAGPLQCMKYRALIAYQLERRWGEVRTMLAARTVARAVQEQCRNYDIQVVEISTWPGDLVPLQRPN